MFNNVGKRLQKLAKLMTKIWMIFFCLCGAAILVASVFSIKYNGLGMLFIGLLAGICVAGFGSFLTWYFHLFMYGFGEIVERNER